MAQIKIEKSTVYITETTIRELLAAIELAKKKNKEFVRIESPFSGMSFVISCELKPHNTQESLGYTKIYVKNKEKESLQIVEAKSEQYESEWT